MTVLQDLAVPVQDGVVLSLAKEIDELNGLLLGPSDQPRLQQNHAPTGDGEEEEGRQDKFYHGAGMADHLQDPVSAPLIRGGYGFRSGISKRRQE